jgi:hypothetical protein
MVKRRFMNKKTILCTVLALSASSALADSFGVRAGIPTGIQYTQDNAFGKNRDLRITAGIVPLTGSAFDLAIFDGDVEYIVSKTLTEKDPIGIYYGAGISFGFIGGPGAGIIFPGVHGVLGMDFRLDKSMTLFFDSSVGFNYYLAGVAGLGVAGGIAPGFGGAMGLKFKL